VREESIRRAYADGHRAYPRVALSLEDFRAHCLSVLAEDPQEEWERHGRDLFLCAACASGEAQALAAFESDVMPAAAQAVSRVKANPEFVQEALQAVSCKLLVGPRAKLAEYSARGSLVAWTKVVATRQALNQLGAHNRSAARHTELARQAARIAVAVPKRQLPGVRGLFESWRELRNRPR
jgi:hypothetical protein